MLCKHEEDQRIQTEYHLDLCSTIRPNGGNKLVTRDKILLGCEHKTVLFEDWEEIVVENLWSKTD